MGEVRDTNNNNSSNKHEMWIGAKAIWRHVQPFRPQLAVLVVLGVISASANGAVPYVTGRFFDALIAVAQGGGVIAGGFPLWGVLLFIWAGVQLVANNVDWVADRLRRNVDSKLQFSMQVDGFKHFLKLPLSFHKDVHIDGAIQKVSQASWRASAILRTCIDVAPQFLSILIGIVLAASINQTLAGILAGGVILYILLLLRILRPIAGIDSEAHRAWSDGWGDAAAAVHQVETVKQAAAEKYEMEKVHAALFEKAFDLWYRLERIWSNVGFFQRMIVFATQLTVFIVAVRFVSHGVITVGELIALNGYALMFFGPFVSLGYSWQTIQNGLISAAHAEEIFQTATEIYTPAGGSELTAARGRVAFRDVSFRYAPDQPEVLSHISADIEPGTIVAFVGESGVGKSTLISLISGYYFPTEGEVLVDGIDTRKINLTNLRGHIGVVPQEVALFNDTIRENITYGTFTATEESIRHAAREAHIDEFIEGLPKKYETVVGERGIKLSVGQKQRIAIARAILRNPAILILDEPTSALDSKTEQLISTSLDTLMQGRTTLIIAHRLSTVRRANIILVFKEGKIVERGTHTELVAMSDGVYRHLYDLHIGLRE